MIKHSQNKIKYKLQILLAPTSQKQISTTELSHNTPSSHHVSSFTDNWHNKHTNRSSSTRRPPLSCGESFKTSASASLSPLHVTRPGHLRRYFFAKKKHLHNWSDQICQVDECQQENGRYFFRVKTFHPDYFSVNNLVPDIVFCLNVLMHRLLC